MSIGIGGLFHGFSLGMGYELTRRVIVPAILVATPLLLWWGFGPEKPTCDAARARAARTAVLQVAERIRAVRGEARRGTVLHFTNDPTDFVTGALRENLREQGTLDLESRSFGERWRNLFNLRIAGTYDAAAALEYGKDNDLDAVIIGAIDTFETVKGEAVLTGNVKFISVKTGAAVDIPLTNGKVAGVAAPSVAETVSLPLRLLLMVVVVVALPVLLFPLLRLVMRRDSNLMTAGTLVVLLAVDGVIIGIALGTHGTFLSLALFLIALAASFGYDLFMLSYAQLCRPSVTE